LYQLDNTKVMTRIGSHVTDQAQAIPAVHIAPRSPGDGLVASWYDRNMSAIAHSFEKSQFGRRLYHVAADVVRRATPPEAAVSRGDVLKQEVEGRPW
jgi:hypothetical protein